MKKKDATTAPLAVYVPAPGRIPFVAPRSGIVGIDAEGGKKLIYFEGNLHKASNILTYADRVAIAAGRLTQGYPTVAKMLVPKDDLIFVGWWEDGHLDIANYAALCVWLDTTDIASEELRTSWPTASERREIRRALREPAYAAKLLRKLKGKK